MLTSEDHMDEGDGFLLTHPTEGLGYQSAGAFQRLGKRMLGLVAHDAEKLRLKHVPMQLISYDLQSRSDAAELRAKVGDGKVKFAVVTPEPELGKNLALSAQTVADLTHFIDTVNEITGNSLHWILALPSSSSEESVQHLRTCAGREHSTVLLCPAVFGFRDHGLMDHALQLLAKSPDILLKKTPEQNVELSFAGDVASLIVSIPQHQTSWGKIVTVTPTTASLRDFQENFNQAFKTAAPFLERLAGRLSAEHLGSELHLGRAQRLPAEGIRSQELFPAPVTKIARALSTCAASVLRSPESDLIFPPAKTP